MKLHEYQSKPLFAEYGIPVPRGIPVKSPNAAVDAAKELGGELWVVKAQVHAGGRGKAGGVKLARSREEVRAAAEEMLGKQLVTHQSGPEGLPVNVVYVESGSDIERELYRQPKLVELRDITQEDDKEREAAAHDLNRAAQG